VASRRKVHEPAVSRPDIPYNIQGPGEGVGLLPWSRAVERLRNAYVYWVATATGGGRPHVIPVWGVWLDDVFYFSNGPTTRTGRNLAAGSEVSVNLESGEDVVILHGTAERIRDKAVIDRVNDAYCPKYLWKERMPEWYAVRPRVAFAWLCPSAGGTEGIYAGSATRYTFDD
jgi:nitroimidazol reductase NimA-like FMN-containing flavoprotein (pyridoxamine 5'-phosphate oxidase superfamily)